MFQIANAVTETLVRLGREYGTRAAVVILVLLAIVPTLKLVGRAFPRGRAPGDKR